MKKINIIKNPYLLFSPFLLTFIIYIITFSPTDITGGDTARYLLYAHNLIQGFFSPPAPNIWLINGPGYPIIIVPFLMLKLPLISIALMNAFFYYFSIILLFKALKELVSFPLTLTFSMAWACYCIAYQSLPYILTETFTYLLVTLMIYTIVKAFNHENQGIVNKYVILTGIIFGYIVLTKMIFGYVLMFMIAWCFLLWIINRTNINYRKGLIISVIAVITTAPYLIYTHNLTGRIFYWGMGSDSMYWMTTPYDAEYGDWNVGLNQNPLVSANYNIPGADSTLRAHHQEDFNEFYKYNGIDRDDAFKRLAFRNIKTHPLKYAQNIVYNMGRLVFHYPFSQAIQKPRTLLVLPINGILLTLMIFSLVPTILNWRKFPMPLKFLLIIAFLYLGASTLATALVRMFTIIVPVLLIWIAYVLQNTMKINLKFKEKSKPLYDNGLEE